MYFQIKFILKVIFTNYRLSSRNLWITSYMLSVKVFLDMMMMTKLYHLVRLDMGGKQATGASQIWVGSLISFSYPSESVSCLQLSSFSG